MEKLVSEQNFLLNPQVDTFAKLIPQNQTVSTFSTKCCITQALLRYPVVNINCTPRCYMNMDDFLKKLGNKNEYVCVRCNKNRKAADVVYDIGFQMIIDPDNSKKNTNRQQIHIDKNGMVYTQKKITPNQVISKKVNDIQFNKINNVREDQKKSEHSTIVIDTTKIRNQMNQFYKNIVSKMQSAKSFLFCRGKEPEKNGKNYFSTIYVFNKEASFHIYLKQEGKEVCFLRDGEVHYIPERRAFYIVTIVVTNQGKKIKVFEGKIDNLVGNKLQVTEKVVDIKSRQFFGVAHSATHIFIVGGQENQPVNTVLSINLQNNKVEELPPMKQGRAAVKACFYKDKLFAIGGASKTTTYNKIKSHEVYDFKTKRWTEHQKDFMGFNMGVFASEGNIIVYGGSQDSSNDKFVNEYKIINPDNFNVISKGRVAQNDIKMEFHHQSNGHNGSVMREGGKGDQPLFVLTFGNNSVSVETFKMNQ